MNTQGLLFVALAIDTLFIAIVIASPEQLPVVTYEDIELLNATCPEADNCREERGSESVEKYNCNCGEFCSQYDTCCLDSKYRDKERKTRKPFNCAGVYGIEGPMFKSHRPVLLIDSCDPTWFGDNLTKELCLASPEEKEDLFFGIPVTNHKTGITYRNYYCAVCNNETDKDHLTPWQLSLQSINDGIMSSPIPELHFLPDKNAWIIGNDTEYKYLLRVEVYPSVRAPDDIGGMVHDCEYGVKSRCANDWNDTVIADKCAAFMSLTRMRNGNKYRNPYCAICNYESLDRKYCYTWENGLTQNMTPSHTFFVRLFSLYDKENKCDDDKVYDTLAKKCRKVYKG